MSGINPFTDICLIRCCWPENANYKQWVKSNGGVKWISGRYQQYSFICRKQMDQLIHLFIALWANTNIVTWLIVMCKRIWSLRVERNWLWNYDSAAVISRRWDLVCASNLLSPKYSMYGLVDKITASGWKGTSLPHYVYVGLERVRGSWHIIHQGEELLLFVLSPTFETTLRAILVESDKCIVVLYKFKLHFQMTSVHWITCSSWNQNHSR